MKSVLVPESTKYKNGGCISFFVHRIVNILVWNSIHANK